MLPFCPPKSVARVWPLTTFITWKAVYHCIHSYTHVKIFTVWKKPRHCRGEVAGLHGSLIDAALRFQHQSELRMLHNPKIAETPKARTLIELSPLVFMQSPVIFEDVEIAYWLMNASRTWPISLGDLSYRRRSQSMPSTDAKESHRILPTQHYMTVFIEPVIERPDIDVISETACLKFHCGFPSFQ